jgi:hypothetical protein
MPTNSTLLKKDYSMRKLSFCLLMAAMAVSFIAVAQEAPPPADQKSQESALVTKMMGYGKKQKGKVSRDEVTDERLLRLFDLADTDKKGVITKEQLLPAVAKFEAEQSQRRSRANAGGGPGGPGGPGGFGGRGPGGFGGRPPMGVLMPNFVQDELGLSDAQRKQLADLQKETDNKLDMILTAEQRQKYKEMKENPGRNGPGGRGFGGRGGPPE